MFISSVSKLMEAISIMTQIPVNKQVLLIANGEPLNPSSRVGSYKSAGTVSIDYLCMYVCIFMPQLKKLQVIMIPYKNRYNTIYCKI